MSDDLELARTVDAVAAAVPGVRRLFAAERGPVRTARQLTSGGAEAMPFSAIDSGDGGPRVTVSVEVDASRPSAETAADVAEAVRRAVDDPAVHVHVRVGRVATA